MPEHFTSSDSFLMVLASSAANVALAANKPATAAAINAPFSVLFISRSSRSIFGRR
jgi:hypothetical protein